LGNFFISSGNGYFITKSKDKIQIILYNYEHFNHLFASGEHFDMTYTKRYTPFTELGKMDVSIGLINLPMSECIIREHVLNTHTGSAFDKWLRMGSVTPNDEEIEYLKRVSVPKLLTNKIQVTDGALTISALLEPLEVRLIEICKSI
jgi:xylan 1,4-beta-xylosidase